MSLAEQPRLFGMALAESWRRFRRRLRAGRSFFSLAGSAPDRLLLAPPDLYTADPTIAQDIYAGIFNFAGRPVSADGGSPFRATAPNEAWLRELNAFGWLRHLAAANDALSSTNAKALTKDWIQLYRTPGRNAAWEVETAARRLINWLCHSVLIVQDMDLADYRRFLRSVGSHIRYLRRSAPQSADGMPRLTAQIALAYAAACVSGKRIGPRIIWRNLDRELVRQILSDGTHISRNPSILPEILALLLPLREAMIKAGAAPSRELVSAIDRIAAALRFFRLGDGSIARFNGTSATPHDLVATVLRYDNNLGEAPETAAHSGFQRLSCGDTTLIMDAARPPSGELSVDAHAGTLSFEMSCGRSPLIVNCGIPPIRNRQAVLAGRSTAAHSTLVVNDTSSCRFHHDKMMGRYLENRIISGPTRVNCRREKKSGAIAVKAAHNGYARRFGLIHERMVALTLDGDQIMGSDRLYKPNARPIRADSKDHFSIRFHLHPSVAASKRDDGQSVYLAGGGSNWLFTCIDVEPELQESVFFAVASGMRRTTQIVLYAALADRQDIRWMLARQR